MTRSLSAVAREVRGRLNGPDAAFEAVTTDTRSLTRGALFVAISGERFDGNDFVVDAEAKGAAGALVSRLAKSPLPQVQVADTRRAFGIMARAWRRTFSIPVVAVTGSAGKTTVKQLIAAILGVRRRVCVTQGNLNNDIGVPLTLMRLQQDDEALVVELGANHAGEIAYLADLVEPTVGVITNASAAHLEGFGSLAGVAAAKGELLDYLPRAGTSVLYADDPFRADWQARARTEYVVTFGLGASADCRMLGRPQFAATGSRFTMHLPDGATVEIELPLLGPMNVVNALAAAAAAQAVGASPEDIRVGLGRVEPVRGRLNALAGLRGATVIDDSYNANPASVRAALEHLGRLPGRRIVVLGDMAELGAEAEALHREIGAHARAHCDDFLAFGALASRAAEAYGAKAKSFSDLGELTEALVAMLASDVTVLVKGSRIMRLERLVAALLPPQDGGAASC
jgi:UDP-N-acetylmuramoyl-tripeptide--D-alanyl-D-alanine ligase